MRRRRRRQGKKSFASNSLTLALAVQQTGHLIMVDHGSLTLEPCAECRPTDRPTDDDDGDDIV